MSAVAAGAAAEGDERAAPAAQAGRGGRLRGAQRGGQLRPSGGQLRAGVRGPRARPGAPHGRLVTASSP